MSTPNSGGPAFPQTTFIPPQFLVDEGKCEQVSNGNVLQEGGMSLRDYFASKERLSEWDSDTAVPSKNMCEALAGPMPPSGWSAVSREEWIAILEWEAKWRAAIKFIRADAMLAERAKEKP